MSVHKDSRSPYWHYDFQIKGQRYYNKIHNDRTLRRALVAMYPKDWNEARLEADRRKQHKMENENGRYAER